MFQEQCLCWGERVHSRFLIARNVTAEGEGIMHALHVDSPTTSASY